MKGPGLRIEIDVRRGWRCPTCGQKQRWPTDITAPRCYCVREGVPMKLDEGQRPQPHDVRPEIRSVLDRIQAGEVFPRMTSLITAESEAGTKPRGRPPRPERHDDRANDPPREPRPRTGSQPSAMTEAPPSPPAAAPTMTTSARPASPPEEDDFGAGIGSPAEP